MESPGSLGLGQPPALLPPGPCCRPASVLTVAQDRLLRVQPGPLHQPPPLCLGKDSGQAENGLISSSRVEGPVTGPRVDSAARWVRPGSVANGSPHQHHRPPRARSPEGKAAGYSRLGGCCPRVWGEGDRDTPARGLRSHWGVCGETGRLQRSQQDSDGSGHPGNTSAMGLPASDRIRMQGPAGWEAPELRLNVDRDAVGRFGRWRFAVCG